jgi:O-6-methylguanine DNA methyltransferase
MKTNGTKKTAFYSHIETAFGPMLLAGHGRTLVAVKFGVPKRRATAAIEELHRELHGAFELVPGDAEVRPLAKQLVDYLDGRRKSFNVELDLSHVTPFRKRVLEECAAIPRGQVSTYAELARKAGRPNAYRAVGHTMATNPIPIVIPCHRVLGSDGGLHGFGGGLDMKRRLLALEGAAIDL